MKPVPGREKKSDWPTPVVETPVPPEEHIVFTRQDLGKVAKVFQFFFLI